MAFGGGGSGINITLGLNSSNFTTGMNNATTTVKSFEKTVTTAMKGAASSFSGLKFPTTFNEGLQMATANYAEFDSAMRNLNSIMNVSESEYAKMSDSIMHINDTLHTSVGAAEAAKAAYWVASHGFTEASEMNDVLTASMVAGVAGLTDTTKAAKLLSGVLEAYHMDASEASKVSDVMFNIVK
jgi:hypothetical protein